MDGKNGKGTKRRSRRLIIEQTAETFRNILGKENVLEYHGGVVYEDIGGASDETIRKIKASENWDMPVIVTTAVQFFESLYSNKPSKCRKLHNIADSVIVFDSSRMRSRKTCLLV